MKYAVWTLGLVLFLQGAAVAAERGTPEYEKLKEYKKAQRAEKERLAANPSERAKGFWAREAERSGLAGTAAMFGNGIAAAVPLEKPNSRKEAK